MNAFELFESLNPFGFAGILVTALFLSGSILMTIKAYQDAVDHSYRVLPKVFAGVIFDAIVDIIFVIFFFISLGMKTYLFYLLYSSPSSLTLAMVYVMIVSETYFSLQHSLNHSQNERQNKLSNRV